MKPFYFGDSRRPLFGVHHPPRVGPRRPGVVVCPPFGQESLRAHRSLRDLATRLAEAGVPALRFDYRGSGDSAGEPEETRLEGWVADVVTAVEEMREATGDKRVSLAGLRLGAAAAALGAGLAGGAESLLLWEPVVDGAAHLAELRRGHAEWLHDHAPGAPTAPDEVLGFTLPAGLAADLDLLRLDRMPATRSPDPGGRERRRRDPPLGGPSRGGTAGGAAGSRLAPRRGNVARARAGSPDRDHGRVDRGRPGVKERALLFGDSKSLTGVITEPAAPPDPSRPAVVFLDAGVLHHVGPNRVHVRLARELAREGFLSLRFDFSGLGDSRPRRDAVPFVESVVAETRAAMDVLAARGARSFLLFGICSGADAALRVALLDARVAGAALVEPYLVAGPGYLLYAYRRKLLDPRSWLRLLRGRSELWAALAARKDPRPDPAPAPAPAPPADEVPLILPSRPEIARQVRSLADRGVGLCFVYAREGPAYHNWLVLLRREVKGALARGTARVVSVARTDHVFTPRCAQDRLVAAVLDWAREVAGRRPPA